MSVSTFLGSHPESKPTCTYSITLSSPKSLFTFTLELGNEFVVILATTCFRLLVTSSDASDTAISGQQHGIPG